MGADRGRALKGDSRTLAHQGGPSLEPSSPFVAVDGVTEMAEGYSAKVRWAPHS